MRAKNLSANIFSWTACVSSRKKDPNKKAQAPKDTCKLVMHTGAGFKKYHLGLNQANATPRPDFNVAIQCRSPNTDVNMKWYLIYPAPNTPRSAPNIEAGGRGRQGRSRDHMARWYFLNPAPESDFVSSFLKSTQFSSRRCFFVTIFTWFSSVFTIFVALHAKPRGHRPPP